MSELIIPLFPLHTVLFPGGLLSLRIFEPRYLDMVSNCMKSGSGFGVCLICEGDEAGKGVAVHAVGALATITDWHTRSDGLLGITVHGQQRFAVRAQRIEPNQLVMGTVTMIEPEPELDVPDEYFPLVGALRQTMEQVGYPQVAMARFSEATWVGCRLAELLPLKLPIKQELLQLTDPLQRLARIHVILQGLDLHPTDR